MYKPKWTEDLVKKLKDLHWLGLSASQIAEKLDQGWSRCAVIGKLHRLGLKDTDRPRSSTPRTVMPKRRPQKLTMEYARRLDSPYLPKIKHEVCEPPESQQLSIYDLRDDTCRWPYGDTPPLTYCGHQTVNGSPYCAAHRDQSTRISSADY